MNKIKELVLKEGYKFNKEENAYSYTYNSIRHFVEITSTAVWVYSCPEGTDGVKFIFDSGKLEFPTVKFIKELINKQKELTYE